MTGRAGQSGAWRRALALALGLTSLGAQTRKEEPGLIPTLVFQSFTTGSADRHADAANLFNATALRDLRGSGAFRLLEPPALNPPAASPNQFWRGLGADFLVRSVSRSVAKGRLLIESECINLATGAVVLKKSFVGETAVVGRMAHRMVDFMLARITGTPGAADSTIVFARSTAPGIQEIFGVDRDGRSPRQLTGFGSLTTFPALAGDGRLACVTYKGGPPQIWGQLTPQGPFQLFYPRSGTPGLGLSGLAWSPDGSRLCFVQENSKGLSDIFLLEPGSGRLARLTEPGHSCFQPCWNGDGTALAFLSDRDGRTQVYTMAADGNHARPVTADAADKVCVAWDPRAGRIAFAAREDGSSRLYTVAADGSDRRPLAAVPEPVTSLCWAPDGRSLLLGVKTAGGTRLRLAGLDGELRDLAESGAAGQFPQWAKNPAPLVASVQADGHAIPEPNVKASGQFP